MLDMFTRGTATDVLDGLLRNGESSFGFVGMDRV